MKTTIIVIFFILITISCNETINQPEKENDLPKLVRDSNGIIYSTVLSGCLDLVSYEDSISYIKDSINTNSFFVYMKSTIRLYNPYPSDTILFQGDSIFTIKLNKKEIYCIYPEKDSVEYKIKINGQNISAKSKKIKNIPNPFFNQFDLNEAFMVSYLRSNPFDIRLRFNVVVYLVRNYGILYQTEKQVDDVCVLNYLLIDKKYYPKN